MNIKNIVPWLFVVCLTTGWIIDRNTSEVFAQKQQEKIDEKVWEAFEVSDLIKKQRSNNRWYLSFLKRDTLSMGLYSLPKGADDRQPAHGEDEVYLIENGKAMLRIGNEERKVQKGSLIFVKRGIPHKFHSIEEPLDVLVFFSSAKP